MIQQTDQIGRCSCAKPIILNILLIKCVQNAERIINTLHPFAKMISIETLFQYRPHLLTSIVINSSQLLYLLRESLFQFFICNTTNSIILRRHADIIRLIKITEHTYLRELSDTGKENELQMFVSSLKGGIESTKHVSVFLLQSYLFPQMLYHISRIHHVEQRFVIFVHQDHGTQPGLTMSFFQNFFKSQVIIGNPRFTLYLIFFFPSREIELEYLIESIFISIRTCSEIYMKHRIGFPFRLQFFDGKSFEQFFFA